MTSLSLFNALHRPPELSNASSADTDFCNAVTHTELGLWVGCSLRSGHTGDSHREYDPDTGEILTEWPPRTKRDADRAACAMRPKAA